MVTRTIAEVREILGPKYAHCSDEEIAEIHNRALEHGSIVIRTLIDSLRRGASDPVALGAALTEASTAITRSEQ